NFYQLSTAYNILTNEAERSQYDRWRTGSIKIPYKMWKEMVMKRGHTVHWTTPPKQPLKITDSLDTETFSNQAYNNNTYIQHNTSKFGTGNVLKLGIANDNFGEVMPKLKFVSMFMLKWKKVL
ncbi:4998_t:CDS:2, partial [Racocetra persica]